MKLATLVQKILPSGGVDRWPEKCGTDRLALAVNPTPVPSTIAALIALPAPRRPTTRTPGEMTIYAIPCVITLWKLEKDLDHHLVMRDELGNTMVCEIPNPSAVHGSSPWLDQITKARAVFDDHPLLNISVTITGVLFFDRVHGVTGASKSGVELHPVLSIERI